MAIVMTGLALNDLPAQVLLGDIYLPATASSSSIPYTEVDFISIRMRGLGYQLHNVARDDVTDLFRNPVTIYNLNAPLIFAGYEQPTDPPIRFQMLPVDKTYLSLGYWSKKFGGTSLPAGIFIRGSFSNAKNVKQQSPPWTTPFTRMEDLNLTTNHNQWNKFYIKLWLGILEKEHFKLALTYNFYLDKNSGTVDRFFRATDSIPDFRLYETKNILEIENNWTRHSFGIGGLHKLKKWNIESKIALLLFSTSKRELRHLSDSEVVKAIDYPDSVIRLDKVLDESITNPQATIQGLEINIQGSQKNLVLFFTGSILGDSPDDSKIELTERFLFSNGDTITNTRNDMHFQFKDNGTLYRSRLGVGKSFTIKQKFKIFTTAAFEYFRSNLKGNFHFNGIDQKLISGTTSIQDTSWINPLNYSSEKLRLLLPVGFEYHGNIFSARLGLSYYYSYANMNIESQQADVPDYKQKISSSSFGGQEFFGLGFRWKGAELNIAAVSEVFKFSLWQVGFRYRL